MEIHFIDTAKFHADGGAMFGAIPKTAWGRKYPSDEHNQCVLVTRSVLIKTDCGKVILIDTGSGNKHPKELYWYRFFDERNLIKELASLNVKPKDVTDVVLSHLHFDHCGYAATDGEPTFPNATYWVSRQQWKEMRSPNPLEEDSFFKEDLMPVWEHDKLSLIDNDTTLCPNINLKLFGGHTNGQIVVYIDSDEDSYVFAGDVIPLAASISPKWISAYDCFPVTSYHEKIKLLDDAANNGRKIIFCHDCNVTTSLVKKTNDFFTRV
jgi:glyoxylase-like metal-dependent hydrolase (beta-lactamase superfamily II)